MKELLVLGLALSSCGVPFAPIDRDSLDELLSKGHRVHQPDTEPLSSLELNSSSGSIFNISKFTGDSDAIHSVSFDSRQMPVLNEDEEHQFCFDQSKEVLNISEKDLLSLEPSREIQVTDSLRSLVYSRKVGGLQVEGAFLECRFAKSANGWKLHSILNKAFFHYQASIDLPLSDNDLFQLLSSKKVKKKNLSLLPINGQLRSVTTVEHKIEGASSLIYLDNTTGDVLKAHFLDLHASSRILMGKAYRKGYQDGETFQTILPLTPITFPSGVEISSVEGRFYNQEIASFIRLESQRVRLFQKDSEETMTVRNFSYNENLIRIDEVNDGLVAINTYAAIHRINKFVRQFMSPEELPFLDHPLEVRVNLDGTCNAYYTTGRKVISLFSAGNGCANIGEVNDVIYHEWGHALDEHTGRNLGVLDGAFSEGLADFLAALYNDDPRIGVGFVQDADYGIRTLKNSLSYPDDVGEPHREGGIVAGAFWDLYEELVALYGPQKGKIKIADLFFGHLKITDTYLESYENLLLVDDDDGNPATPNPHLCAINRAFAGHGLAKPLNCRDSSVSLPPSDHSLSLALYTLNSQGVSVVGSSSELNNFSICLGPRLQCLRGDRVHLELPYLTENDSRTFYGFQGPLSLTGFDLVTLLLKDEDGLVLGSRQIKIVTN